jgi:hypothetical protein
MLVPGVRRQSLHLAYDLLGCLKPRFPVVVEEYRSAFLVLGVVHPVVVEECSCIGKVEGIDRELDHCCNGTLLHTRRMEQTMEN